MNEKKLLKKIWLVLSARNYRLMVWSLWKKLTLGMNFLNISPQEENNYEEIVRKKVRNMREKIEREVDVHVVDLDIYVHSVWHLQDCSDGGNTIDQFEQNLHRQYSERANSYSDAKNRIGDLQIHLHQLASSIGTDYMPRISTYDTTVSRHLYRWGSQYMRKGNTYLKRGQYPEAKERYLEARIPGIDAKKPKHC